MTAHFPRVPATVKVSIVPSALTAREAFFAIFGCQKWRIAQIWQWEDNIEKTVNTVDPVLEFLLIVLHRHIVTPRLVGV